MTLNSPHYWRLAWKAWDLTHWDRSTHICIGKLTIIGSDNGLSPGPRQAIIWTNAGILLIRRLGTNFKEILIEIYMISFKKIRLKMSSGKWRPFCFGLNVLTHWGPVTWCQYASVKWVINEAIILLQIMAWCLFGAKPLSKPMMSYCQLDNQKQTSVKSESKYLKFSITVMS